MKKIYILLLSLFCSVHIFASPEKPIYAIVKDKSICIYTNDIDTKPYNNQIYLYMGGIVSGQNYKSTYSKIYKNIKMPIDKNSCIPIPSAYFNKAIPFDVTLDMEQSYARRICVNQSSKKILLTEVKDGYKCSNQPFDYSEKKITFLDRLFEWIK